MGGLRCHLESRLALLGLTSPRVEAGVEVGAQVEINAGVEAGGFAIIGNCVLTSRPRYTIQSANAGAQTTKPTHAQSVRPAQPTHCL